MTLEAHVSRCRLKFRFHLFEMKVFGVEFRPYNLNLVDRPRRIAKLARRPETVRAGRRPQPHLIDPSIRQVQSDSVSRTVLAQIERHAP